MGLVDYAGSGSDSDQEEEEVPKKIVVEAKKQLLDDEDFFDNKEKPELSDRLKLNGEDVLEDIVKPKDWEVKLAEKARKKLEKKAMKKALKQEKKLAKKAKKDEKIAKISGGIQKKDKGKVVISAFGGLPGVGGGSSSDESDGEAHTVSASKKKLGNGFLSTLPAPKGRDNRSNEPSSFASSLIPPSVAKKATSTAPPTIKPTPASRIVDDSDDDDDEPTDFFGFSSVPAKTEDAPCEVPFMPVNSSMDVVGPCRPAEDEEMDVSQMYRDPEEDGEAATSSSAASSWLHRKISDEQAHKLLMRFSHDIGPEERRSINEMASSIVDVNVDAALGPDVKQNILKNLGHRSFVESTKAPLPTVQTQGQTSRRKHQITYLASQAVAREEQLKDQWADQKQSKRMARQKYGF